MLRGITKNQERTPVLKVLARNFGVYQPVKDYGPAHYEKIRYKELLKREINLNAQMYRDRQDEIDLDYIKQYESEQYDLMINWTRKQRSDQAIEAFRILTDGQALREDQDRKALMLKEEMLQEEINRANRRRILETMNLDSQFWLTSSNIDKAIDSVVVIPDNLETHSDYHRNLQSLTLEYSQGKFTDWDANSNQEVVTSFKNSQMVPIYQKVKGLIKFMKREGEDCLLKEYEMSRAMVLKNFEGEEAEKKISQLDRIYNGLVLAYRKQLKDPKVLITHLHRRYLLLYNILKSWQDYSSILRMSQDQIFQMMDERSYQEEATFEDLGAQSIHHTQDEDIETSEDSGTVQEFGELKKSMEEGFQNKKRLEDSDEAVYETHFGDQSKQAANDESFDSDPKSIDDTTAGSEMDSTDMAGADIHLENLINWEDIESSVNDQSLEVEFQKLEGMHKMYGNDQGQQEAITVQDLLTKFEIERLIPKDVVDETFDLNSPSLQYKTVDELKLDYEVNKTTDASQFNSGLFINIAAQSLSNMDTSNFTIEEMKRFEELEFLLQRIGNIKINESDLLVKLFETLQLTQNC